MDSKITLFLLFSLHYAAMQELGSPQGRLPGATAHDHNQKQIGDQTSYRGDCSSHHADHSSPHAHHHH